MFLLHISDLFEYLGLDHVRLTDVFAPVAGLRDEEEHEYELQDQEALEEVEQPEET